MTRKWTPNSRASPLCLWSLLSYSSQTFWRGGSSQWRAPALFSMRLEMRCASRVVVPAIQYKNGWDTSTCIRFTSNMHTCHSALWRLKMLMDRIECEIITKLRSSIATPSWNGVPIGSEMQFDFLKIERARNWISDQARSSAWQKALSSEADQLFLTCSRTANKLTKTQNIWLASSHTSSDFSLRRRLPQPIMKPSHPILRCSNSNASFPLQVTKHQMASKRRFLKWRVMFYLQSKHAK